jgi:hypothetical protein
MNGFPKAVAVDKTVTQPRRNVAAMFFVITHPGVFVPANGALSLTGFAPTVQQSNTFGALAIGKYHEVDRRTTQPRRNIGAAYLVSQNVLPPNNVQLVLGNLAIVGQSPSFSQGQLIYVGQDTNHDWAEPELFQPARRDWVAYFLSQPLGKSVNLTNGTLTISGLAPSVSQSGIYNIPVGSLTLNGQVPTFAQAGGTQVDIAAGALALTGLAPNFQSTGPITVPAGQLILQTQTPTFTQAIVPTYAGGPRYTIQRLTLRNFTISAYTGPRWDIKSPTEQVFLTVDFSPDLATGETLIGGPAVTYSALPNVITPDPNPGAINNGGPGFDITKTKAIVPVQGGVNGNDYLITVTVNTSTTGKVLTLAGILPVRSGTGV